MLLKQGLAENITGMKEVPEGLNLYFENKSLAANLVDFLVSVVPIRRDESKRLISQDFHSNITKYKYTVAVEIAPICREDIVFFDNKNLSKKLGGDSPFLICVKVTNQLTFVNPFTLHRVKITPAEYFKNRLEVLCNSRSMVEFLVIDVRFLPKAKEPKGTKYRKAAIECVRSEDVNEPENYIEIDSHLGNILRPGDLCLGYDLRTLNLGEEVAKTSDKRTRRKNKGAKRTKLPNVILVRKVFERKKRRGWKLRRLAKEKMAIEVDKTDENSDKKHKRQKIKSEYDEQKDEERFLQELEENEDMRRNVQIWENLP
ncbi:hypothetical protein MHBO_002178, partial [Bonamia ostreae]